MALGGHSATSSRPPDARPPTETGVPPKPKPQPWQVDAAVTNQSITRTPEGRYLLVAEANDGFRWQVDVTEAVHAAALNHREQEFQELEADNERAYEWLQWYAEKYGVPGS